MSVNKATIMGRIGKIEQKFMPNGKAVTNFSVACSEKWKDKNTGEQKEKTEWINCVCFDRLAENIFKFFPKGSGIYAEGKITTRKWQDQSGQDRYTTELLISEFDFPPASSKGDNQQGDYQMNQTPRQPTNDDFKDMPDYNSATTFDPIADDIPF